MGIKLDIFPGVFDFTGSSSGSSPAIRTASTNNATVDWSGPSGGEYSITILQATHLKGTSPNIEVFELTAGVYYQVSPSVEVDASGNVTVRVTASPDLRFAGKILII